MALLFQLKTLEYGGGQSKHIHSPPHPTIKELMVGSTAQGHHLPPGLRDDDNYSPNSENVEFGTFLTIGPIKGGRGWTEAHHRLPPPPPPQQNTSSFIFLFLLLRPSRVPPLSLFLALHKSALKFEKEWERRELGEEGGVLYDFD